MSIQVKTYKRRIDEEKSQKEAKINGCYKEKTVRSRATAKKDPHM